MTGVQTCALPILTLDSKVNLEGGTWNYAGRVVRDAENHGKHEATVLEAFEESSNVGMAKLAVTYFNENPQAYFKHLSKLRIDTISGIDLMGEGYPLLIKPTSKRWGPTTLPWMAFGYNIAIAPIQTLTMYNSIANGGVMMKPYLVNAIKEEGKVIKTMSPKAYEGLVCSPSTLKDLHTALEGVCTNGTAKKLFTGSLYKVAGKTGTALVADGNKGYADNIFQSSFVGYFPAENPQYTIAVIIINHPNAVNHFGASVAGPVFKEIADRLYSTYIQNKLDDNTIIFYEGWVDSCWDAVYNKQQYQGMNEEQVMEDIIKNRFPRIGDEFSMLINDYGYFYHNGYIMYV